MLRDAAVAVIKRTLGFRTTGDADIVQALQDAQELYEGGPELPFFLRSEIGEVSTAIGIERLTLPTSPKFIREWHEDALYLYDTTADIPYTALQKDDLDFLRKNLPGSGKPTAYALGNEYIRLFKTPDAVYTLRMIYYGKDDVLEMDVENKWLQHVPYLLIGEAGVMMAAGFRDKAALAVFSGWKAQGYQQLLATSVAFENAGRQIVMGGEN